MKSSKITQKVENPLFWYDSLPCEGFNLAGFAHETAQTNPQNTPAINGTRRVQAENSVGIRNRFSGRKVTADKLKVKNSQIYAKS